MDMDMQAWNWMNLNSNTTAKTLCAILIALLILAIWVYSAMPTWRLRRIPAPPSHFLLGHLPLLASQGPDVFVHLACQYGPLYRFNMGRQPVVIVADAELCREVGIKKFKHFTNRSVPAPIAGSPLHTKGLFFSRDGHWSSLRSAVQPLYQPSSVAMSLPLMDDVISDLISRLDKSDPSNDVNLSDLCLCVATDVIGQAAFGEKFNLTNSGKSKSSSDEVAAFINQHVYSTTSLRMDLRATFSVLVGIFFPILQKPVSALLRRVPGTADREVHENNQKLSQRLEAVIQKRRESGHTNQKRDFLSVILNKHKESLGLSIEDICALTYEHLLAGSATTSFTLATTIYLIAQHPHVEDKLINEIDGFGPSHRCPTAEELDRHFPYLHRVVKEAMRYYTVSPVVAREASSEVEIGGYRVRKGTWVWMALNAVAKDNAYYEDAHVFRPERFDPEIRRHPYADIPFGIGPRSCPGMRFALQEIKLGIVRLYQRFRFEHSPAMERPLQLDFGIVVSVRHGVRVRVVQRRRQDC